MPDSTDGKIKSVTENSNAKNWTFGKYTKNFYA